MREYFLQAICGKIILKLDLSFIELQISSDATRIHVMQHRRLFYKSECIITYALWGSVTWTWNSLSQRDLTGARPDKDISIEFEI